MPKKYIMPKYLLKLKYPHWCEVATTDYSNPALPLTDEGNPNWEMYFPFGADVSNPRHPVPKRIRCRKVVIYQSSSNPDTLYPSDAKGLSQAIRVYIPPIYLDEDKLDRLDRQDGWVINVYERESDREELADALVSSCAAVIYRDNNPHIEFVCTPM